MIFDLFLKNGELHGTNILPEKALRVRGVVDMSSARPGRKQATATKLGIYSTYSPGSSIRFLARCSNLFNPLKKKNQNFVRQTRSPRQQ
jgi:hypothetical protein